MHPLEPAGHFVVVLKNARVRKIIGRSNAQRVRRIRIVVGKSYVDLRKQIQSQKVDVGVAWAKKLRRVGVGDLSNEADPQIPRQVGSKGARVIERENLAAGLHCLRESQQFALREGRG